VRFEFAEKTSYRANNLSSVKPALYSTYRVSCIIKMTILTKWII